MGCTVTVRQSGSQASQSNPNSPAIFIILGDDPDEIRCYLQQICSSRGIAMANLQKIDAEKHSVDQIQNILSPSLFDDGTTAAWIFSIDKASVANKDALQELVLRKAASTVILTGTKIGLFAEMAKAAIAQYNFRGEKKWQRKKRQRDYLAQIVEKNGKTIDPEILEFLTRQDAENLLLLVNEIEKAICYVAEAPHIDLASFRQISKYIPIDNVWKKSEQTIFARSPQDWSGEDVDIFAMIARLRYQADLGLYLALAHEGEYDLNELQKQYPHLKGNLLKHYMEMSKDFGREYYIRAKKLLFEVEFKAKQTTLPYNFWCNYVVGNLKGLQNNFVRKI